MPSIILRIFNSLEMIILKLLPQEKKQMKALIKLLWIQWIIQKWRKWTMLQKIIQIMTIDQLLKTNNKKGLQQNFRDHSHKGINNMGSKIMTEGKLLGIIYQISVQLLWISLCLLRWWVMIFSMLEEVKECKVWAIWLLYQMISNKLH